MLADSSMQTKASTEKVQLFLPLKHTAGS